MILLGSIERAQVGALLSQQLSPQRRLQALRQKVLAEDEHRLSDASIRFQVRGQPPGGREGIPSQSAPHPHVPITPSPHRSARRPPRVPLPASPLASP